MQEEVIEAKMLAEWKAYIFQWKHEIELRLRIHVNSTNMPAGNKHTVYPQVSRQQPRSWGQLTGLHRSQILRQVKSPPKEDSPEEHRYPFLRYLRILPFSAPKTISPSYQNP
ncbi:hypothetical protein AVEN_213983-1 [Araneus ventricosus]|uniref:Uncharacterized protein n=1 Tax=Araneus ventricosus TaxID=182803 RepID=A0A4Y2RXI2_ARAVE|nr:hypothetical protein AVEN_213983-1 [Araneus ventricosus]